MQLTLWEIPRPQAPRLLGEVLMQNRTTEPQTLAAQRRRRMRELACEYGAQGMTMDEAADAIEREFGVRYTPRTVYTWSGGTLRRAQTGRWVRHLAIATQYIDDLQKRGEQPPSVSEIIRHVSDYVGDAPSAEHMRDLLVRSGASFRQARTAYSDELKADARALLKQGFDTKRVVELLAEQHEEIPHPSTINTWRSEWGLTERDTKSTAGIGALYARGAITLHQAADMLYEMGLPDWIVDQAIMDAWTGGGISSAIAACKRTMKNKRRSEGPSRGEMRAARTELEE